MTAIGYIRQSKRADLDLALSYDSQLAAIGRLATRDGTDPENVRILSDMGRSGGRGKERLRAGYQDLLAAIEAGTVDVIYALSMSRVARSTVELQEFYGRCVAASVRVVYEKEAINFGSASGKMHAQVLAAFYEFERDLAVERARDNVAERRRRGERMGRIPYGERPDDDPAAVLEAWAETHSLTAAARRLNLRRVPSWSGKQWTATGLRFVLLRIAPGSVANLKQRGVKPSSPFLLYRLLRCPCGRTMTASRDGRGNREAVYRCHAADTERDHPRPYRVRESLLLPWIKAEAARLHTPDRYLALITNDAKRTKLEDQRRAIGDALTVRAYTVDEAAAKVKAIEDKLAMLETERHIVDVPALDWSWTPKAINAVLAAMWGYVELGSDLQPVRAEWTMPAWRLP